MYSIYESLCDECDVGGGYGLVVSSLIIVKKCFFLGVEKLWMFWLPKCR